MTFGQPEVSTHQGIALTFDITYIMTLLTSIHGTISRVIAALDASAGSARLQQLHVVFIPTPRLSATFHNTAIQLTRGKRSPLDCHGPRSRRWSHTDRPRRQGSACPGGLS